MATHRKKSAKRRISTGEFAVAAFLGLAVTAAPAVAVADTSDNSSNGPAADNDSDTGGVDNSSGGVNAGPKAGDADQETDDSQNLPSNADDDFDDDLGDDDADLDEDEEGDLGVDEDPDLGGGEETDLGDEDGDLDGGQDDDLGTEIDQGGAEGSGTEVIDPPVDPTVIEPPVDPVVVENPEGPVDSGAAPIVVPAEIPLADEPMLLASRTDSTPAPTPPALASALLDIDLVPQPPNIPAFAPFMGFINFIGSFIEQLLPAYPSDPILNPTQVAAGWVTTLFVGLQTTYAGGQPTLFTFGAYILMTAAYQRYEKLATNHLPGQPVLSAGPAPLTWKLTSSDPDGDPLVYFVDLDGQPANGLITMLPNGSFTFLPTSLSDLNSGTDVTFTVRVNDGLGFLEHPITPDGNDAEFVVTFHYPGLGINSLPVFNSGGQAHVVSVDPATGKVTIAAEATDADGDPLTYTGSSLLGGSVVRNADGTFTYTPTDTLRHLAGTLLGAKTDIVSIWANDGRGGITLLPTVVTVDIVSDNQAPVITVNPDTFTESVLGSITGSLDIDDPDGDIVLVTPTGLSTRGGVVTVIGHTYTYIPTAGIRGQGGTDTFTLTVNDMHGSVTEVTVTVTVAQINVAPVFEQAPTITHTDHSTGVLTGTFQVRDGNGDALTFTSAALLGTISVNTTPAADGVTYTFTYTPHNPHAASLPLAITTDLVTITAWDGGLLSADSATFLVQLSTQVNQTPSATYQNTGGSSILGTVTGEIITSDDDSVHTYTPLIFSTGKGSVMVSALTGHYTYTASMEARNAASAANASAADKIDTFTITVTDPAGASTSVVVTVDIPQWNLPPAGGIASNIVADNNGVVRGRINGVINLDGDPLSYSIAGTNGAAAAYTGAGGIAHVDADGNYIYIPRTGGALGYYDSFSITVSDGRGGTTDVLVGLGAVIAPTPSLDNVNVSQTNGAPGIVTGGVSLGSAANNGLFSSFTGSGAGHGTVVFDGVSYTYTRTSTGHVGGTSDTFDIIATAYGLTIKIATVTVTPAISNAAPAAGTPSITESDLTNLGLIYTQNTKGNINAVDADGDPLTYQTTPLGKSTQNGGLIYVSADGSFTYIIAKGRGYFHGASAVGASGNDVHDTVTIEVTDSFGASTNVVVVIPIEKVNAQPSNTASVSGKTTDALGVVRGTVVGSDSDDDGMTYTLVGGTGGSVNGANGGIIQFNGSSFTYVPTKGVTSDSFQVLVNDGHGGTNTATVNLTGLSTPSPVTGINTSTANVVTGQLNTAGNTVGWTYSLGTDGAKAGAATVVGSTGAFTYTRNATLGHSTSPADSFTIVATETATGRTVVIATINVAPSFANNAPAGNGVTTNGPVGSPTLNVLGGPSHEQNTNGTLHATDADGDPVTFTAGTYNTANGGSVTVTSTGTFSYSLSKFAPFGIPNSYWHDAAATGYPGDTFTVSVTDGFGGVTAVTYAIPVATLNKLPDASVSVGNKATDALGVVRGTVTGSDDDDDAMTYTLVGATGGSVQTANGGIVQFNGNSFTYVPTKGVTSDSFQVLVNDGHGGVSTATVNLTGLSTPSPVTGINTSTANVVTGQLNTAGNTVGWTYSLGTDGAKAGAATVVGSTGAFTYTRNAALGHSTSPADSFTIVATETATGRTVVIATINVAPVVANNAPTGNGVTTNGPVGSPTYNVWGGPSDEQNTTGTLNASDADGDPVTFTAGTYSTANGGSVTVTSTGTFSYSLTKLAPFGVHNSYWHDAAATGYPGDTFTVNVSDGFGGVTAVTYAIPVATLNKLPDASVSVGNKATDALGVVRGTVTGSDDDDDAMTYSLAGATGGSVQTANGGIVQFSGNSFTYVPTKGVTSDSFQVLVNDGHGGVSTATVNLTGLSTPSPVTGINTSTVNTVAGQLNTTGNTTGWTYSLGTDGAKVGAATVVTATGAFTYVRNAALGHTTTPADSFTIRATETATGRSVIIATINVTPTVPNNAPTATLTAQPTEGTLSGTIQTSTGKITTSDADGDTRSYEVSGLATGASVTFNADGSFTYTANISTEDRHKAAKVGATAAQKNQTFTVTVKDAYGGAATPIQVTVPIYAVNSRPTISGGKSLLTVTINTDDGDGDGITNRKNPAPGEAGYVLSNGGTLVGSLDFGLLYTTTNYPLTITVWDGYYVVTSPDPVTGLGGGQVTTTLSTGTRTWT